MRHPPGDHLVLGEMTALDQLAPRLRRHVVPEESPALPRETPFLFLAESEIHRILLCELTYLSHRRPPRKAGTHNHRRPRIAKTTCHSAQATPRGMVPAFAGTTMGSMTCVTNGLLLRPAAWLEAKAAACAIRGARVLPTGVRGSSWTNSTAAGSFMLADLWPVRKARSSSAVNGFAPSRSVMKAFAASPR